MDIEKRVNALELKNDRLVDDINEIKENLNQIYNKLTQTIINQEVMTKNLSNVVQSISDITTFIKEYTIIKSDVDRLYKDEKELSDSVKDMKEHGTDKCPLNTRRLDDLEKDMDKQEKRWWLVVGVLITQLLQIIYLLIERIGG